MNHLKSFSDIQRDDFIIAERMAYIDFRLNYTGRISRNDLGDTFGLAEASATRVLRQYNTYRPSNMNYDRSEKVNVINKEEFTPLINIRAEEALEMLASGFNKNRLSNKSLIPYVRVGQTPNLLNCNHVAMITRAMYEKKALKCCYNSANSMNSTERVLVPLAILFDGRNWIFRAFERNESISQKFKNFNFARIASVKDINESQEAEQLAHESLFQDIQWNTIVPVALEIHPDLTEKTRETVRNDFGIAEGEDELFLTERSALVWLLLHQWNVEKGTELNDSKGESPLYWFKLKNLEMLRQYGAL
ncbi:WYL domain-containing protein [Dickeya dadantii]|uniref:WYL domain-containing protein n=1 Tax=Dickeya dadantii TaxID=204038 RepID=UPI001495A435|nr:WYL domain-containing protein [Dickeya dadantii]NPE52041.1 WYL domain-containing protein [Dickeya dadantii]